MTLVRKFGTWSGKKEIESVAVDDELGFIYYSDEGVGVRKYAADPELRVVKVAAHFSAGSDVPLNAQFPHGMFVAMSDNKTFQYYRWEDMLR